MDNLLENDAFTCGVNVGINLYKSVVVKAHERNDALIVGDNLYYLQNGRERLQEVLNKICE